MTYIELAIMPREFNPHETHFFSIHKNIVMSSKMPIDKLLTANGTLMKLPLRQVQGFVLLQLHIAMLKTACELWIVKI